MGLESQVALRKLVTLIICNWILICGAVTARPQVAAAP